MNVALVNPRWTFEGSVYFGCREPHLPLEYGYARALLERDGHRVLTVDAHLHDLATPEIVARLDAFAPDMLVVTTAPSYLFWRCAPPELRVPRALLDATRHLETTRIIVGPHGSTTPATALRKLEVDAVVLGECEEVLPRLAVPRRGWSEVDAIAHHVDGEVRIQGRPHASDMSQLPALSWPTADLARHTHHHHRFERPPAGAGAEVEVSRGCPYHCTFCAKDNFRDDYRRRPVDVVLREIDGLLQQGVEYVYFIDEIFLPNRDLLEGLVDRPLAFGVQTRIESWTPAQLELLGRAGCVSIEAGVESVTAEGRQLLDKGSRMTTDALAERLIEARSHVPFVQANLLDAGTDDADDIERWRHRMHDAGVWANKPVPMFPYPGSPSYRRLWGAEDDTAWERAMSYYLVRYREFSDIQEARPKALPLLESWAHRQTPTPNEPGSMP